MRSRTPRKPRPPLEEEALERLALFYAGRYATTRAKLAAYLDRKIRERGWEGRGAAPVDTLVERFAVLGYVDDRAFAAARTGALLRRGYGQRRVAAALRGAGIGEADAAESHALAEEQALAAAHRFARRKRLGPYGDAGPDPRARQKAAAAMIRAGHRMELVWRVLGSSPGDLPDPDVP
ncbi:MAG TPA: RecX family transcriptional regulator [Allosphingosinicella sp.]|nr:RecX family transcriptional regulator [Allosphingosinicella sp.]